MRTPNRIFSFAFIFFFALLYSCTGSSQSSLPDTWQPGMKLTMSYGGGMRYYSYHIEIADTGSYHEVNEEGKITRTPLKITAQDLSDLLAFLKSHHLDHIKTEATGLIYDKGTESILLSWGNHTAGASDGSTTAIAEKSMGDFNAISTRVFQLVEKSKEKVKDK
ncbi:MAG: hypothetical protein U0U70_12865 [Chitinophagaceae bacterium]